jgi:hypothetical protein
MRASFSLFEKSHHARFLGTRHRAKELRLDLESLLDTRGEIALDFTSFEATQSFIDELIGQLVLRRGEDFLSKVTFMGCSEEVKAIINFVVSDRLTQFRRLQSPYIRIVPGR